MGCKVVGIAMLLAMVVFFVFTLIDIYGVSDAIKGIGAAVVMIVWVGVSAVLMSRGG